MDDSTHSGWGRPSEAGDEGRWFEALPPADVAVVLDGLGISAWTAGQDGAVARAGDEWARLVGQSPASSEEHGWLVAVHPDDRNRIAASWDAFAASGARTWSEQYRVLRLDTGEERVIADRAVRVAGRGAPAFLGVSEDVTVRLTAETRVRELEVRQSALQRVAMAVSKGDAQTVLQTRVAQQAAVNDLSTWALGGRSVAELFDAAVTTVAQVLGVPLASVVERHVDGTAVVRATRGSASVNKGLRFPASRDTLTGAVLATGLSLVVDDFEADGRFGLASQAHQLTGMRGGACFVIRLPDRLWGVVAVFTAEPRTFTADDVRFLESVANVLGSTIERAEAEHTIRHQAMHDPLTGIPNRTLLVDRLDLALERAARDRSLVGVLYINLDRFKDVNDSYGHTTGDALLIAAAERLTATLRPGDTIARVGGDEFAVVAEALAAPEEALALAERLLRAMVDPQHALPGASIGVAVRKGGDSAEDAIRDAHTALYRAKASGRGRVELFDNEMRARMLDRLRTEADLRHALERREFDLHYQPIVRLADGAVAGFEGLVRWHHPTRGLIPPGAFIGIAEETGAIIELGRFVIARACADAARWNAMLPDAPPVSVNVNLSALQLGDAGLPEFIATSLAASGVPAGQLGLEITETVVIDDVPEHTARLLEIKRLGVRLLLDDFGTGYSSFGHLRRLPLDILKLDRSFVAGIGRDDTDTAIVVATRQLARALGLDVVAEGVETREQLVSLQSIGCEYAQGYYFARPLTRAKVDRLLAADPPWRIDHRRTALGPDAA